MTNREWLYEAFKKASFYCQQSITEIIEATRIGNCWWCIYGDVCETTKFDCKLGVKKYLEKETEFNPKPGTANSATLMYLNNYIVKRFKELYGQPIVIPKIIITGEYL